MASKRFGRLLRTVRRRLIVTAGLHQLVLFVTGAAAVAFLWLVLTRLFPVLGSPRPALALLVCLAAAAALVRTWVRRPSYTATALEVDRRLGLEERITSSVELEDAGGAMVEALHRDAETHSANIHAGKDFPVRIPALTRWLALVVLVYGLAYVFLPEFDVLGHREREAAAREIRETMQVRARRLEEAVRPIKELPETERHPSLTEDIKEVQRIAEGLESGELSDKQALAKLTDMAKQLREEREKMAAEMPSLRPGTALAKLDRTKELASSIQEGDFDKAAEKARELQQQLAEKLDKEGGLTDQDREALAQELKTLAEQLGGKDSMLGQALEKAAEGMTMKDAEGMLASLEQMQMSLEDVASAMEQMQQMELAMECLGEGCKACSGGKFDLAAFGMGGSGQGGQMGQGTGAGWGRRGEGRSPWSAGTGQGSGPGMGGPGSGRGGNVGELPEVQAGLNPTFLPGEMTPGKVLSSIMKHNAPDEHPEATAEYISETILEVQQAAEEALTKEEIPQGSKEFVRQYFGSLEPDRPARTQHE